MNFKNHRVLEDLFELSKKADEIIEKSFAGMVIDVSFLEETKNKIRQILDDDYTPRESFSRVQKENGDFVFGYKPLFRPLTEYRSHVHAKNENQNYKSQTEDSTNTISLSSEDVKSHVSVGHQEVTANFPSGVNDVSQTNQNDSRQDSTIVLSSDSVVEVDTPYRPNTEDCVNSSDMFGNINGFETNMSNSKIICNQVSLNSQNNESDQLTPDMKIRSHNGIGKTIVLKRNKIKKLSFINDRRTSNCKGTLQNKTLRPSNKKIEITAPKSLDVPRSASAYSPDNAISRKRCAISSVTKKRNKECSISKQNCMIDAANSPIRSVNTNVQHSVTKCLKSGKRKKFYEVLTETNALLNKENIANISEDNDVLFHTLKRKKSREYGVCNNFSKIKVDLSKIKSEVAYGLRSLGNNCSNVKQPNNGSGDNEAEFSDCKSPYLPSNYTNPTSEFNRIKSALKSNTFPNLTPKSKNKKSSIPLKYPGKRKFSHMDKSSSDSTRESDNREYGIKDSKQLYMRKELVSTKNCRTILNVKKSPSQFQTKSAPARHKKTVSWKPRPSVESVAECNRQSLKVKTEEKRKQREIRVQRTKERRERLEKEREEKIRLGEQRLKQRFQQHEEMLKQKTEKFKIKPRKRQGCDTKRNPSSSSSKESNKEDTARDNDDCCRNSEDSGQKLSKESNGYREKADFTPLEGNAGINPGISEEHNAILVSCEKTPVELAVSCNGSELESASVSQHARGVEEFERSHSQSLEQQGVLRQINIPTTRTTSSCSENEDVVSHACKHCQPDKPDVKFSKKNLTSPVEIRSKSTNLKKLGAIGLLSNKMFCKDSPEKHGSNVNSYFLRSGKKVYPNKAAKSNAHMPEIAENEPESNKYDDKLSREMITPSPVDVKGKWSNLCFNYKPQKPKMNSKIPAKKNSRQNGRKSMHTRISKNTPKISNIEIPRKNIQYTTPGTGTKEQAVTSYKISDFSNESFHESQVDLEKIPLWATGVYLKQALVCQHYKPLNVEKIFGIPNDPVDLVDMFHMDKPEYHKRTSSDNWSITPS